MTERKPLTTEKELARAFDQLFAEMPLPEAPEEIDAILREAGYIPDEVGNRTRTIVENALTNSPLNWRNRSQELEKMRQQVELTSSTSQRSRSNLLITIQQILTQWPKLATAHFRNLETVSDEDLASLLSDLEYLISQQSGSNQERGE